MEWIKVIIGIDINRYKCRMVEGRDGGICFFYNILEIDYDKGV